MNFFKKSLLFFIGLITLSLVMFVTVMLYKPGAILLVADKILISEYSISTNSIKSNKSFLNLNYEIDELSIYDKNLKNIIYVPKIRIGINLLESLKNKYLVLSMLEISSFKINSSSSKNGYEAFIIKGDNLTYKNDSLSISAKTFEIFAQSSNTSISFNNGKINNIPYKKIDALVNPSLNKIFYSTNHWLDEEMIEDANLINLSSFSDSDIKLNLDTKGSFDYKNNKTKRITRIELKKSLLVNKSGFKVTEIFATAFSNLDQSLYGFFRSAIPDQNISGSLSYGIDKVISIRSDISINMNSLLKSNTFLSFNGSEVFSSLMRIDKKNISMELKSNLQETEIISSLTNLKKDKGLLLNTRIFIEDMSKPSYNIKNIKFAAFIDNANNGYFSFGNYFDTKINAKNHIDGFYVYLDLPEANFEDFIFNSSSSNESFIKSIQIYAQQFNLFENIYTNQVFDVSINKNDTFINILGKNLNGNIKIDKNNFTKVNLINSEFLLKGLNLLDSKIGKSSRDINMRFIGKNIKTQNDILEEIDFYLLKNKNILTLDNINITSSIFKIGTNKNGEKAYISFNSERDLYKIKGSFEIDNSINTLTSISSYDFSFLKTDLNIQWNSLSKLLNLEGGIEFLVKDLSMDGDMPNTTFLKALRVFNLNAIFDGMGNQNFSNANQNDLEINRAAGSIYFSQNRGFISSPIILETDEASMKWLGEISKNNDGELNELNLDLSMRLKISENIPWYAAIFGGMPALAGGLVLENIFESTLDNVSTISFKVNGTVDNPELDRLN